MKKALQQVKVTIDIDVATAFKQACVSSQKSMAMVLAQLMSDYVRQPLSPKGDTPRNYSTRRLRRAAIRGIIKELNSIKRSEERSRDNTPINLQGSEAWEKADEIISLLEEAIANLEDAIVP